MLKKKKKKKKKEKKGGQEGMMQCWIVGKLTDLRLTLLLHFNIYWGTRTIKETK